MNLHSTGLRLTTRSMVIALLVGLTGIAPEFNAPAQASSNSFAGVTGLASRFIASDLNPLTDTWVDSANSNITLSATNSQISSNLQKITSDNTSGTRGSTASFPAVAGTTIDFVNFPTRFGTVDAIYDPGDFESYTIFYVARYSNSSDATKRERIVTSTEPYVNVAAGFHGNSVGKMFYVSEWLDLDRPCYSGDEYICQASSSPTLANNVADVNDWALIGFRFDVASNTANFRTNGALTGFNDNNYYGHIFELGINSGDYGLTSSSPETSDFEIADYMVFNRALTDSQMNSVEIGLATAYGLILSGQPQSSPTPTPTPTPTPNVPSVVSQPVPITQVDSRTSQSVKRFAATVKRGKKITLPLKTYQGSNITYSTSKGCKLSKKFKTVTVKVGKKKKKVKVQTSWQLQGTKKKAACQVTVAAFETSSHLAFLEKRTVRVR